MSYAFTTMRLLSQKKRIKRISTLTLEDILTIVAEATDLREDDIQSKTRKGDVKEARQLFCWFARKYTARPLEIIGKTINRDHATVLHSIRVIDNLITTGDRTVKEKRNLIKARLEYYQENTISTEIIMMNIVNKFRKRQVATTLLNR